MAKRDGKLRTPDRDLLTNHFREMGGFNMGDWGNYGILWPEFDETKNFQKKVTIVVNKDNNKGIVNICDISYEKPKNPRKDSVKTERLKDSKMVLCDRRSQIVTVTWPNGEKESWKLSTYWHEGLHVLAQNQQGMWLKDATFEQEHASFGVASAVAAKPLGKGAAAQLLAMRACLDAREALF